MRSSPRLSSQLGDALVSADIGLLMDSYEVYKKYFDFWFAEFEPFEWDGTGSKVADAEAHFLPPNYLLDEAMAAIDYDETLVGEFLVGGKLAISDQAAADLAHIVEHNFTIDGVVMDRFQAQHIHVLQTQAIDGLYDQFFIAGRDYNENYSNPDKEGEGYIASFFEREDTILGGDDWEKLYSPTEGLGRINRNLEGIPTATFWDLDFAGSVRVVEPYQLDDGSNIFVRVPKEWWENYTVQALGNDRTEPDGKKLQYVGNVDTYDETVGYVRNVAQLLYEQEWSTLVLSDPPSDPEDGDVFCIQDNDKSPARWVVSYLPTPAADWPDEYAAYTQYSIHDGRETDESYLPYVQAIFTGLITLEGEGSESTEEETDAGLELLYFLLDPDAIRDDFLVSMFLAGDRSVKTPWEPKDWDLGDPGHVTYDGTLYYRDQEGTLLRTHDSDKVDGSYEVPHAGGWQEFTGGNWALRHRRPGPAGVWPDGRGQ